jgi:hypothetical protein
LASSWDGPAVRVQPEGFGDAAGAVEEAGFWAEAKVTTARPRRMVKKSPRRMDSTFMDCTFINFPQGLKPPLIY